MGARSSICYGSAYWQDSSVRKRCDHQTAERANYTSALTPLGTHPPGARLAPTNDNDPSTAPNDAPVYGIDHDGRPAGEVQDSTSDHHRDTDDCIRRDNCPYEPTTAPHRTVDTERLAAVLQKAVEAAQRHSITRIDDADQILFIDAALAASHFREARLRAASLCDPELRRAWRAYVNECDPAAI
jgi:hypothetical protein